MPRPASLILYILYTYIFNEHATSSIIRTIESTLFPLPGGFPAASPPDPDEEEQDRIKERAYTVVKELLPGECACFVLGKGEIGWGNITRFPRTEPCRRPANLGGLCDIATRHDGVPLDVVTSRPSRVQHVFPVGRHARREGEKDSDD